MTSPRYRQLASEAMASMLTRVAEAMGRLEWSPAQLADFRREALRDSLAFASERSAWHRPRLAGLDLDTVDADDLSSLPTMTKADLMANWDAIVTDPRLDLDGALSHMADLDTSGPSFLLDEYHVFATGGSTGEPGIFCWSRDELAGWASGVVRWTTAGGALPQRTAYIGARSPSHPSGALPLLMTAGERSDLAVPIDQPLREIVDRLNGIRPDSLWMVASMLPAIVAAARDGSLKISVDHITLGSDTVDPAAVAEAEAVFGVRPLEGYPTTDVGTIAHQMPGEPGLYVNEDLMIIEPVDEADRPVPPGTSSHHLLVTSLHQRTLPLIRYRIDDRVLIDPEPGRYPAWRRVAAIDGRSDDVFTYGDLTVHPHTFRSVLARHPEIHDYEVRQTVDGVEIDLVAEHVDTSRLRAELAESAERAGLEGADVAVSVCDSLPRTAVGKRLRFIPLADSERKSTARA